MEHNQPQEKRRPGRGKLILRFLKGSKAFFLICMVCAALSALADMITPQIIRVTVDNILGSDPVDNLSPLVQNILAAAGGTEYLRGRLTFDVVQEHVKLEEQKWIRKAKRFILYDDAPYRMK